MIIGERGKHKRDTWKQKVKYVMLHILWRLGTGVFGFEIGIRCVAQKDKVPGLCFYCLTFIPTGIILHHSSASSIF